MMQIKNLEVVYQDSILAVRGVSIEVPPKERIALLGANGAGKTTILRAISGLLGFYNGKITEGSVSFDGEDTTHMDTRSIVRRGLSLAPEGRRLFEHLSVEENLLVGGSLNPSQKVSREKMERVFAYFPRLAERRRQTCGYLSGGEQQMLVLGRALMSTPKLLAVDELSLGLAPMVVQDLAQRLSDINREEGVAILLVEQNAEMALSFVSYAYVLETGRIVLNDRSERLRENPEVKEFYLGMSVGGEKKGFAEVKFRKREKGWLV